MKTMKNGDRNSITLMFRHKYNIIPGNVKGYLRKLMPHRAGVASSFQRYPKDFTVHAFVCSVVLLFCL